MKRISGIIIVVGIIALFLSACTVTPRGAVPRGSMMRSQYVPATAPVAADAGANIDAPDTPETRRIEIGDKETIQLDARAFSKTVNGVKYTAYGYDGQTPGPTFIVKQESTIFVNFTNNLDEDTTVHWHGLRQNYKDDGVPGLSQAPIKPGDSFLYTLNFPDEGLFWYHPHIREDRQQDLGLYGNILVEPNVNRYNRVDKEETLVLDDILIGNGRIVPYGTTAANYALMGRYGNAMLVNGQTNYHLNVQQGQTVRFYITSVANVRPFNISIPGAQLKIVGGDIGRYEREQFVDSIIIGPAERYIIEVTFPNAGNYELRNENLWAQYTLGTFRVIENNTPVTTAALHDNQDIIADIDHYRQYFDKPVDKELDLTIAWNSRMGMMGGAMHSTTSIEWEDTMEMMNSRFSSKDVRWIIRDKATGAENDNINYTFKKGDIVKIRINNDDKNSEHPMQHSIHFHGQRFLVLDQDGTPNNDLVWKDTVLVPTGSYVDILLDANNPGNWMMHCHIAEHLEASMMGYFTVNDSTITTRTNNVTS